VGRKAGRGERNRELRTRSPNELAINETAYCGQSIDSEKWSLLHPYYSIDFYLFPNIVHLFLKMKKMLASCCCALF